jgi:hypothetical protein
LARIVQRSGFRLTRFDPKFDRCQKLDHDFDRQAHGDEMVSVFDSFWHL